MKDRLLVRFGRWLADAPPFRSISGRSKNVLSFNLPERFTTGGISQADKLKYQVMYEQGGWVSEALDVYPLMALTNGWRVVATSDDYKKKAQEVENWLRSEIMLDELVWHLILDAHKFGKAYAEKQRAKTNGGRVNKVKPCDSELFKDELGEGDNVVKIWQTNPKTLGKDIPFDPKDMVTLELPCLIRRAKDDIDRDTTVIDSLTQAIKRHGTRKYHVRVGREGEPIPQKTIDGIAKMFENLKSDNEIVTVRDVETKNLDEGTFEVKGYSDFTLQRGCAAMGVPEEMLGLGRGSTEATANVRLTTFYDKIGTDQRRCASAINEQLIDEYIGLPGKVRLMFNDVSPEDELKEAQFVEAVCRASGPVDPWQIMTPDEARQRIGLGERPQ